MSREYKPVPVSEAAAISEKYGKEMVIILAWDMENVQLHTTTFGTDQKYKDLAAAIGDGMPELMNADPSQKVVFQDFRKKCHVEGCNKPDHALGCCRWCCTAKHDHIQCTDSSRCHCKCHGKP